MRWASWSRCFAIVPPASKHACTCVHMCLCKRRGEGEGEIGMCVPCLYQHRQVLSACRMPACTRMCAQARSRAPTAHRLAHAQASSRAPTAHRHAHAQASPRAPHRRGLMHPLNAKRTELVCNMCLLPSPVQPPASFHSHAPPSNPQRLHCSPVSPCTRCIAQE